LWSDIRQGQETTLVQKLPKIALGRNDATDLWVAGHFTRAYSGCDVKQTTRLRLVPELLSGATPPLSSML
jgi:hypothetical protein